MPTSHRALSLAVAAALAFALAGCDDEPPANVENTSALCHDTRDNDTDLLVDCRDPDCAAFCAADADADVDADGDGDADADVDEGVDADPDVDPDLEVDAVDADPDVVLDADPDVDPDVEADVDFFPLCLDDSDCPATMKCYDYLLDGVLTCAPRGRSCRTAADCAAGVECAAVPEWSGLETYCLVTGDACTSAGDCPDGFRCEGGSCVDRRFTCAGSGDCTWWDLCAPLRSGLRVCLGAPLEPCTTDEECASGRCLDIEGDGDTECQEQTRDALCLTNADCDGAVCGDQDGVMGAECGAIGPCLTDDDCPGGRQCVDVNADGQLECQSSGGACLLDRDCPARQLCVDRDGAGGAECVAP